MKSVRRVRYTLALDDCWLKHPGTNGKLISCVAYARLWLLDFRFLQCIRTWGFQKGPTVVTTAAYPKTIRGIHS
jgi:hypothetical protein